MIRLFVFLTFLLAAAYALDFFVDPVHADASDSLEEALVAGMRAEVDLGGRPIAHCRHAGPPLPGAGPWARCERRLRAFAHYFVEAAAAYDVDPWLLAAIARKESGYHPFAEGRAGEGGIMQLHPRNRSNWESVAFIRHAQRPGYLRACRRTVGACQEEVVQRAAEILRLGGEHCDDPRAALNAYNLGARCSRSWRYAGRVYEIRARLMSAGGAS